MQKSLAERAFFKLSGKSVDALPEAIRPKLTDLVAIPFTHEKDFLAALGKALPRGELETHKGALLQQSTLPTKGTVNDGGGLDTMTQLLLGRGYAARETLNREFLVSTADLMTRGKKPTASGRLRDNCVPSRRWSKPIADQPNEYYHRVLPDKRQSAHARIGVRAEPGAGGRSRTDPTWMRSRTWPYAVPRSARSIIC
jgi:hypothetical protein